ncbi:1165_t:CDS:1, partial [Funneliformis caledonium]
TLFIHKDNAELPISLSVIFELFEWKIYCYTSSLEKIAKKRRPQVQGEP